MKYTAKLVLELKMKDFHKCAKPLVDKDTLKKSIRNGLMQCCDGIINGDDGGLGWKYFFYHELVESGIIELTKYGKDLYGANERIYNHHF